MEYFNHLEMNLKWTLYYKNIIVTDYEISPEKPPIIGYTGHIPGVKGEVALSKRYAQAAKKGLELVRKEREERFGKLKDTNTIEKVLNVTRFNETNLDKTWIYLIFYYNFILIKKNLIYL